MVSIETMRNLDAFMRIAPFLNDNMRKAGDQSSSKLFCKKSHKMIKQCEKNIYTYVAVLAAEFPSMTPTKSRKFLITANGANRSFDNFF